MSRADNLPKDKLLIIFAWALTLSVSLIAFIGWAEGNHWKFSHISSYKLFPLFGLLAFSLMWSHYIVATTRQYFSIKKEVIKGYFEITSFAVFLALLFHPGLLIWQLWRDGLGLPPQSYIKNFVAPGLGWIALLGTVSWFVFMSYEFRRLYSRKSWWRYVQLASDAAILAVYYHGLQLGTQLQRGWLKGVWYFYGLTLMFSLAYIYLAKWKNRQLAV